MFVLPRIFAQSETCNANWFHYILVNEVIVRHARNFFDDTPKEHVANVRIIVLPAWPLL